ncbi:Flp family type IVb pilin [Sansalvadorimonas verongulae]|uniref:Flp family type IVb pilin n=1 Tax=Sansalvadorimonas verongulae TaxID=2172824 RepID=UPI0012BD216E|nr:hypothetical protein [Sansalvadorimonas verongulae]MTI15554.1 hypothetical protein [Sansalvadorimonas verongulae]
MMTFITKTYVDISLFMEKLHKDNKGLVTIEYALLAATMIGIITAVLAGDGTNAMEGALREKFNSITEKLKSK